MFPAATLYWLMFLGGFGALGNELLFLKYIENSIGSPLYSMSLVLMAFFAGTLVGNAAAAHALSLGRPRLVLAVLAAGELLLLASALLLVPAVGAGKQLVLHVYNLEWAPLPKALVLSFVGFGLLLLPSALMGLRSPVYAAWLTGKDAGAQGSHMDRAWGLSIVGSFLGVLLAYGMVNPFANRCRAVIEQDGAIYHVVKQIIIASLHGHPQPLVIEAARSSLIHANQPGFAEVFDGMRGK